MDDDPFHHCADQGSSPVKTPDSPRLADSLPGWNLHQRLTGPKSSQLTPGLLDPLGDAALGTQIRGLVEGAVGVVVDQRVKPGLVSPDLFEQRRLTVVLVSLE